MKICLLTSAIEDLAAAKRFYDQHGTDIGDYYFDSLFSEIDSLILYAGIHSTQHGFHRLLAKRFPYAIYYKIKNEEIIVYRILHCSRAPIWIQRQLKK